MTVAADAESAPFDWDAPAVRRGRRVVFAVLAVIFVLCQFQRSVTGVLGPTLRAEMGLTAEELGWITGAFFWGVAVMQIPSGILFDHYGPRLTVSVSLVAGVAGGGLFAVGRDFWTLTTGMALLGLGTSAVLMGAIVLIGRWYAPRRFATMAAAMMSLGYVGNLLATQPFVELIKLIEAAGFAHGWRIGFAAAIAGMLATAGAILWIVRDAPPGSPWDRRRPEPLIEVVKGLREVFRHPAMIGLCGAAVVGYSTNFALRGLWLGTYMLDVHGMDADARGTALLVMALFGTGGIFMAGWLAGRARSPRPVVIGFIATTGLCLAVLVAWPGIPTAALMAVLFLFSSVSSFFPAVLEHGRSLFDDRLRGRSLTSINVWVFIGVGVTQPITGYVLGAFPVSAGGALGEDAYRALFGYLLIPVTIGVTLYARFGTYAPAAPRRTEK
ncbi:MAG: MFS transporter [Rhodospirillales bacterium]|nr:MAG: MFS transporter [Rhodospirillales bacterium]